MTKADIVERVCDRTGYRKRDVQIVVDGLLDAVSRSLVEGRGVEIRGFGSFKSRFLPARQARNPRTGETVHLPEREVPIFKASKKLRDDVERGASSRPSGT